MNNLCNFFTNIFASTTYESCKSLIIKYLIS